MSDDGHPAEPRGERVEIVDDAAALAGAQGSAGAAAPAIAPPQQPRPLFRAQAIEAHRRGTTLGSPLHVVPGWIRWSMRAVGLVVASAAVFAATVRVGDYARGPAVIRMEGRQVLASLAAGSVTEIPVQPGQRVRAGAVLLRLDDGPQRAELEHAVGEYELLLGRLLREPDDEGLRKQLASLDVAAKLARSRLDERVLVAPQDGTISDIRVRVGQAVQPGDALVAVDRPDSRPLVVAMLPGHERPRLSGDRTRMLLELDGFPRIRVPVEVRSIADEVVGPAEALRFLGKDQDGAVELHGPVVMVEASIDGNEFESDDGSYRFYDGMQGALEIEVDSRTLLESVLPGTAGRR
ncbi:MAG: HlyD family efflux transporter periplasmic adaptor subunit [Nannocystaceae bacterium]|nr:HlyD family efflux transporter periplasmic adaptor subunit [Deltaproteobacteria bacterium]MBK8717487.1 HlyD family efflux transporter periplasmic adaptor subunit [Deltaproteobacteria bacterium]MBP7289594.1 HlyD family efflux transporter periplasmic adaptor subunit [Nannocystaceae bacterium]